MISPEPVGAGSAGGDAAARARTELRGGVNPPNPRISGSFSREPIRVPAVPNGLVDIWLAEGNRLSAHFDHEHRPFILVQPAETRDVIVREMTGCKAVASDGASGKCERLPGVPHVV